MSDPDIRIQGHELCMVSNMQFQQHWETRVKHPIVKALNSPSLLIDCRQLLAAGDKVCVCFYKQDPETSQMKLLEMAELRIIEVTKEDVDFARVGPIYDFRVKKGRGKAPAHRAADELFEDEEIMVSHEKGVIEKHGIQN